MKPVRATARAMLSAIFVSGGWSQLQNLDQHAEYAKLVTDRVGPRLATAVPGAPSETRTLVMVDGAVKLGGGLLLATGWASRPAAVLLAASLVPTTLAAHPYWQLDDPQQRMEQRIHFFKNLGLLGGLLLAAVDTGGRPGLTWRAGHLAGHLAGHAGRAGTRAKRATERAGRRARRATERTTERAGRQARRATARAGWITGHTVRQTGALARASALGARLGRMLPTR